MDWNLAITRNRDALISVVAGLYAYAGLAVGVRFSVLPRGVYLYLLRHLRTTEAAVRRLIFLAARDVKVSIGSQNSAAPSGISNSPWWQGLNKTLPQTYAFPLIEPLKSFREQENPPTVILPRIGVPGVFDPVFVSVLAISRNEPVAAASLSLRLAALQRALGRLSVQARRLARWQARRDLALQQKAVRKPVRLFPFRLRSPLGARKHRRHEVDHILRECHLLMLDWLADTS